MAIWPRLLRSEDRQDHIHVGCAGAIRRPTNQSPAASGRMVPRKSQIQVPESRSTCRSQMLNPNQFSARRCRTVAVRRWATSAAIRLISLETSVSTNCVSFRNHQPGLFCRASAESAHQIGSGPGIRTLNLAVNRSLQAVQQSRSNSLSATECHHLPLSIVDVAVRKKGQCGSSGGGRD